MPFKSTEEETAKTSIPKLAERMSHLEVTRFYLFMSLKSLRVARSSWLGNSSPRGGRKPVWEKAGLSSKRHKTMFCLML